MGKPLTLEDALALKKGDRIFLIKDIGNGWTPDRELTVNHTNLHANEDIREVYDWVRSRHEEHEALKREIVEIQADWPQSHVAITQGFRAELARHGIEIIVDVAADDLSKPLGKPTDGRQVYAGVGRPYTDYSLEREPKK